MDGEKDPRFFFFFLFFLSSLSFALLVAVLLCKIEREPKGFQSLDRMKRRPVLCLPLMTMGGRQLKNNRNGSSTTTYMFPFHSWFDCNLVTTERQKRTKGDATSSASVVVCQALLPSPYCGTSFWWWVHQARGAPEPPLNWPGVRCRPRVWSCVGVDKLLSCVRVLPSREEMERKLKQKSQDNFLTT